MVLIFATFATVDFDTFSRSGHRRQRDCRIRARFHTLISRACHYYSDAWFSSLFLVDTLSVKRDLAGPQYLPSILFKASSIQQGRYENYTCEYVDVDVDVDTDVNMDGGHRLQG